MTHDLQPGKILLIEEDDPTSATLSSLLVGAGHTVERVDTAEKALEYLEHRSTELILFDIDLPRGGGLEVLPRLKESDDRVSLLVMTGQSDVATVVEAMKNGADNFLPKPVEHDTLLDTVARALQQQRHLRHVLVYQQVVSSRSADDKEETSRLVGRSEVIDQVRHLVRQVATTDASVMLLGESGTGKGMVARTIHRLSRRASGPFVDVNCATLPAHLVESEIFGHEKGAFTGATGRKPGLLEVGEGGTVFLDEIADLQASAQSKLLKAIEERSFRRVGGVKEVSVDVRFVVATHRDLDKAVAEDRFREDLYYRLNVFQIHLPPLRERGDDVLELAHYFIRTLNPIVGRQIEGLSTQTAETLTSYDWPGNVRELRNVVERAMILAQGKKILPRHLPENLKKASRSGATLPSLAEVEREHLQRVLRATGFNIQRSAEILGISRSTLYSKIKSYEIPPPDRS